MNIETINGWEVVGWRKRSWRQGWMPWEPASNIPLKEYYKMRDAGVGTTTVKVDRAPDGKSVTEYLLWKPVSLPSVSKVLPKNRFRFEEW